MTLAECKRRLQVGTRVVMTYHRYQMVGNKVPLVGVTRVVAKKQTNAVAFVFPANQGARPSWLWWPKASEFKSDSDDEFSILEGGEILMSYKILECEHVDFDEDQEGHRKCRACGLEADEPEDEVDDNQRSYGPHQARFHKDDE